MPRRVTKPTKYRNEKVTTNEGTFDSKGEYAHWCQLKLMERAGAISGLRRQVPFDLAPSVVIGGRKKPVMKFVADFAYLQNGVPVVADFKSPTTAKEKAFRMKLHLMKSVHGTDVLIVMAGKKRK